MKDEKQGNRIKKNLKSYWEAPHVKGKKTKGKQKKKKRVLKCQQKNSLHELTEKQFGTWANEWDLVKGTTIGFSTKLDKLKARKEALI